MPIIKNILGIFALLLIPHAHAASVDSFAPQGTVKGVRQVTARFSEAMVPFGDPRLDSPFTIDCAEKGSGRWADSRNWVFDFERDLPAGIACKFILKVETKTHAGKKISGNQTYSFNTGGPAIMQSLPREWERNGIDEQQIFILGLDAPAKQASILANASCDIEGVNEKVGVRIVQGAERKALLDLRKDFTNRYFSAYANVQGQWRQGPAQIQDRGSAHANFLKLIDSDNSPLVVLQCQRTLPNMKNVSLVWGKGITTPSGVATDQDQRLDYKIREIFEAKFTCPRVNSQSACIPILPMQVVFSAAITRDDALKFRLADASGKVYSATLSGTEDKKDQQKFTNTIQFAAPLPELTTFKISAPDNLKDDGGRPLTNPKLFPLEVKTAESPPLAKFPARFGIIEAGSDAALPVTLRNVEATLKGEAAGKNIPGQLLSVGATSDEDIIKWMMRVNQREYGQYKNNRRMRTGEESIFDNKDSTHAFNLPKPAGPRDMEVVGIPMPKPGFYVLELASPRLGEALLDEKKPYYVQSSALVTNMAVHFKKGRESSLVWVTSLDTATPVANADISIRDCRGRQLRSGQTDAQGIARFADKIENNYIGECSEYGGALFVSARKNNDLSFVWSNWNKGIDTWRFNVQAGYSQKTSAATVFDRTLLRAGETVHMKHLIRDRNLAGFTLADTSQLDEQITLLHIGSAQKYTVSAKWDARGIAENKWEIPKDAKQGQYHVRVRYKGKEELFSGEFRVEAFRVPTMRATLSASRERYVNADTIGMNLQLNYLSGGGAANASVKLRNLIQNKYVYFPDYEGYSFANGGVKEGVTDDPANTPWYEGEYLQEDADEMPSEPSAEAANMVKALPTQTLQLDGAGGARATISGLPKKLQEPKDIQSEMEYSDANGEILNTSTRTTLWPAQMVLGVKPDSWAVSKNNLKFQAVALDLGGKPLANVRIDVDVYQRETYSHRKRLVGGFYAYENINKINKLNVNCAGATDNKGLIHCAIKSPVSGNVILAARAKDSLGNSALAKADTWVAGSDYWWFDASDNDRMDLLPEKKRYEPNDTAVFQVRMPFKQATALVSVEREGIAEAFVTNISGESPTIKVPLKGHYAPNIFVSVLAVRGRVGDSQPTAMVDLGKPAFKLGIAEIKVGWQAHELKVNVAADKSKYPVRDKAQIKIKVSTADGTPLAKDTEVALAAIDEGLLELMPNKSWDLLETMMQVRGIEVETSTAQMQVVGRRHFGRKAVAPGGGGSSPNAKQNARELFDTLLSWSARVRVDANGEAKVEIPLNDSLTAFRIVAVANAGADKFGSGHTSIRTQQDLMLFSGLPPLVREQDKFSAMTTVRNASERSMRVKVAATAIPVSNESDLALPALNFTPQEVTLQAGESKDLLWEMPVPVNAAKIAWGIAANEQGATGKPARDELKVIQNVIPAVAVRTFQATLLQLDASTAIPVAIPADAISGRGGLAVKLQDKLATELAGVREYMHYYPYSCLEQRVSRAIALRDKAAWDGIMAALPSQLDSDGMAKYFPFMSDGSDTLTAYLVAVADEAGWEIPQDSRQKMQGALTKFVEGKLVRHSGYLAADLVLRKLTALEALSRGDNKIDARLIDTIIIEPNLWPTSAVIDWYSTVRRSPQLSVREKRLDEAEQILRSRLNFQGTIMGFSTERSDYLWWLMVSGDVNANRILLAFMDEPKWREDMPRLIRGSVARQHRGHWNTTVANVWGVLAMEKFSAAFESQTVSGLTAAAIGGDKKVHQWGSPPKGATLMLDWPKVDMPIGLVHEGKGKPWVTLQSLAAIPLKKAFSSGYNITRTMTAVERKQPNSWSRGDVMRIRIDVDAQTDMTWVVVDDPIPAGASIIGTGLAKDSQILTQGEKKVGWVWPAFEERKFDAFRAYYQFVPKGKFSLEYTVRLNNAGEFQMPQTRVEAMYSPELFGEIPGQNISITH